MLKLGSEIQLPLQSESPKSFPSNAPGFVDGRNDKVRDDA
jgi:hypothetical protein